MIELTVNRASLVPIHEQLKHQLRYAIYSGRLSEGELLPSLRELTVKLKVNRNTVHRVYLELQAEGLLASKQGKGMYVRAKGRRPMSPRLQLGEVHDLAQRVFREGLELGVNPTLLAQIISHRAPEFDRANPCIAFVECTAHASDTVAEEISESWGVAIVPVELEKLKKRPGCLPSHIKYIITSFFHEDELEDLAVPDDVMSFIITYDLQDGSRDLISGIPSDKRSCFVCKDLNSVEILSQKVRESHPNGLELTAGCSETPEKAVSLIEDADVVIFTEPALGFVSETVVDRHELIQADFEINEHSLESVREKILPY